MARKKKNVDANVAMRGMFRIQINENDGKVVGDSGWVKNTITNVGLQYYLSKLLAKSAGSSQISYVGLGCSAYAQASDMTALTNVGSECGNSTKRQSTLTLGYTSRAASGNADTIQWTGTFQSTDNFVGAASTLRSIGLYPDNTAGSSCFSVGTYASSQVSTNQNVNFTYQVQFTAT
jgi:hypothetical protein